MPPSAEAMTRPRVLLSLDIDQTLVPDAPKHWPPEAAGRWVRSQVAAMAGLIRQWRHHLDLWVLLNTARHAGSVARLADVLGDFPADGVATAEGHAFHLRPTGEPPQTFFRMLGQRPPDAGYDRWLTVQGAAPLSALRGQLHAWFQALAARWPHWRLHPRDSVVPRVAVTLPDGAPPDAVRQLKDRLQAALAEAFPDLRTRLRPAFEGPGEEVFLFNGAVDKSTPVAYLLSAHAPAEVVIAAGDGENDRPLLEKPAVQGVPVLPVWVN